MSKLFKTQRKAENMKSVKASNIRVGDVILNGGRFRDVVSDVRDSSSGNIIIRCNDDTCSHICTPDHHLVVVN